MNRLLILILILIVFLYGCSTPKQTKEVIYVQVPSSYLVTRPITKPIDKETYRNWTPEKKESYLANYISDLLRDLDFYKTNLESLNEWVDRQNKLFKENKNVGQ